MSLESFIDIRFGDPVISISLNSEGLVYGSMMGRLLSYNYSTQKQRVINELSAEYIAGAWISEENVLFVCIGDLKGLVINSPFSERYVRQYVNFEKIHSSISCELAQIKMHKDTIFLAVLEPPADSLTHTISPISIIDLSTQEQWSIEGVRFSPYCVFFDFDGKKLLFMEFERGNRVLYFYRVGEATREIRQFSREFGKVAFCKVMGKIIIYVHQQKVIKAMDKNGTDKGEVGRHENYIVALGFFKFKTGSGNTANKSVGALTQEKGEIDARENNKSFKRLVISVDFFGCLRIWDNRQMIEEIRIDRFKELTEKYRKFQYFSMGYPYYVAAYGCRIALTTDIGVLLVRSRELERLLEISK